MPRNFRWRPIKLHSAQRTPRFWLQLGVAVLATLNLVALLFYLFPPGGSREELAAERDRLHSEIAAARKQNVRLKDVAGKVQLGGQQSADFEARYILPQRTAYETVIAEIQRMAQAASLVQREGVYAEEPIEGTADLSVLNVTVNFEGTYADLMRFLFEADRSPMLLMLDSLQATPEKDGRIAASVRFQAIIREEAVTASGGQP